MPNGPLTICGKEHVLRMQEKGAGWVRDPQVDVMCTVEGLFHHYTEINVGSHSIGSVCINCGTSLCDHTVAIPVIVGKEQRVY
jgi:hypothetical protein